MLQEVVCVHSAIEKWLRNMEVYSPVGLLRQLSKLDYRNVKLCIIQMKAVDFKNYKEVSNHFEFSKIPFTKVKFIKYTNDDIFNSKRCSWKRNSKQ